jgi:hypothetical protein
MRSDSLFHAFDIRCRSAEEATRVKETLARYKGPEGVIPDVVRTKGQTTSVAYRVGDFFSDVLTLPGIGGDACAVRVVFHRRPDAGRFWKDIMVRIVRSVEQMTPTPAVQLAYRGDEPLDWQHLTPLTQK